MPYFEILYQQPFLGIDNSVQATDIDRNHAVDMLNFFDRGGMLSTAPQTGFATNPGFLNTLFSRIKPSNAEVFMAGVGINRVYKNDGTGWVFYAPVFGNAAYSLSPVQGIGGKYYICNIGTTLALSAFGVLDAETDTLTVTSPPFMASLYLGELAQHLVALVVMDNTSGNKLLPQRVRWSGVNNFSQFDSAVDATAGFQDLTDIQDFITGFFTLGKTGVILRQTGLTEVVPTNSGTAPFEFQHIWTTNNEGIGCWFPNTSDSFGSYGVFVGREDVYLVDAGLNITPLGGTQKNRLFRDIAVSANGSGLPINGSLISKPINPNQLNNIYPNVTLGDLDTIYILTLPISTVNPVSSIVWIYHFRTKSWSRHQVPYAYGSKFRHQYANAAGANPYLNIGQTKALNAEELYASGVDTAAVNQMLVFNLNPPGSINIIGNATIKFKEEEVQFGRSVTVTKVLIEYLNVYTGPTTVNVTVSVKDGWNSAKNSITVPVALGFSDSRSGDGKIYTIAADFDITGERPQLSLSTAVGLQEIIKLMMVGQYGEGEII